MGVRAVLASAALGLSTALGTAGACSRHVPGKHAVTIRNFTYQPETLHVAAGDTVVWTNTDFVPHTATARDNDWDSQTVGANGTWTLVARASGRHAYYCVFHPNMQGVIEVR
jgi:plastocyanin